MPIYQGEVKVQLYAALQYNRLETIFPFIYKFHLEAKIDLFSDSIKHILTLCANSAHPSLFMALQLRTDLVLEQ